MPSELERYTTDDGRVYTDGDSLFLPSVTTILNEKPEPDGLTKWKQKNDGSGDSTHWREILMYKSNRGTMIHYNLLNEFAADDMFSEEESNSKEELKLEGDWKRYQDDLAFAEDAWNEITELRGIETDNVLDVECFVTNTSIGYAGQFDLLYIDRYGNLTLSDIKTSKGVYDKHMMQLVAYEHALNLNIDQLEVIRIHPDSESWEVAHDTQDDWFDRYFIDYDSKDEIWHEFRELRQSMDNLDEQIDSIVDDDVRQ